MMLMYLLQEEALQAPLLQSLLPDRERRYFLPKRIPAAEEWKRQGLSLSS